MSSRSIARIIGVLVTFATASTAQGQGSWLPFGTLGASDIAVSPSGVVWLIAKEPRSIRSSLVLGETKFFTPRGSPARVAVDLNGFPWLLNSDGSLWHYTRTAGKEDWVESPLKAIDISVGATGAVWGIDTDRHVVQLKNGAWESIGGTGVRIAVDPSGNPWVVTPDGQVAQWNGNSWKQIAASATDISIAPDGAVFILGTTPSKGGFALFRLNGSAWEPIAGGGGVAVSAGTQAVFLAQDTTTNMVVSSANSRLRVASASASTEPTQASTSVTAPPTSGTPANPQANPQTNPQVATTSSANGPGATANNAGAAKNPENGSDKGGSSAVHAAGSVVGGAVGLLGGLLSKGASAVPLPVPTPGAIEAAVGAAAAGAAANAAGGVVSSAAGKVASSVQSGSAATPGNPATTGNPAKLAKNSLPQEPKVPRIRPPLKLPLSGKLVCPIIGGGTTLERACEIGRAALKLRMAPSTDCAAPSFADPRNGGECWTCPVTFVRGTAPVDSADACVETMSGQRSVATLVKGCAAYKTPPGYGTPFRDSPNGSECYVCPLPLQRSWSTVRNLTQGNLSACLAKARDHLVWQLTQYPEVGTYRFTPGLISLALADPKAVDVFLDERANGDTAVKRAMWARMIADPAGSPELKALLFASLLKVATDDSANVVAKDALGEFEKYMRARRVYVADEALRMYKKAREVDASFKQVKDSGGLARIGGEAVGTAVNDFKTYAWSAVMPDSAGTEFILASAALSKLGVSDAAQNAVDAGIASLNVRYLAPVTKALEDQLDMLEDKGAGLLEKAGAVSTIADRAKALTGADPAMISSTLLSGAMKVSKGVMSLFNKDKLDTEYEKYVAQMSVPVRVKDLLESSNPDDRQSLLLYWALATSAHKASDTLGTGALNGAELCSSDSWTATACSSAKTMIAAAAKAAGYSN